MLQPWHAASSAAAAPAASLAELLLLPLPVAALPLVLGVRTAFVFDQMDDLLAKLPTDKVNRQQVEDNGGTDAWKASHKDYNDND